MGKCDVVVFGYDELLLESVDFFSNNSVNIVAVVFPSNRTDWRAARIREAVKERGIFTLDQPPSPDRQQFVELLTRLSPDFFFVWSYPMILSKEMLDVPKGGCINLHLGLLPEYRGVNGIRWALLNGEERTGVTIHFMDEGIDTGDIIARAAFPISETDDILSLMRSSRTAGLHLLKTCWPRIASGDVETTPQDDAAARYFSSAMAPEQIIDWSKTNVQIHNLIRASVAPFPGVHTFFGGNRIKIKRSKVVNGKSSAQPAGTIESVGHGGSEIATGDGLLLATEIEMNGESLSPSRLVDFGIDVGSQLRSS